MNYIINQENNAIEFVQKKKLAIRVIMDCRTTLVHKFITRLGFNSNLGGLFRGSF